MNVYERAEALLRARLAGRRNLAACLQLGLWLLRWHGGHPGRLFPVPRLELAQDERFARVVGLSPAQIRGAVAALEDAGLLARQGETVCRWVCGKPKRSPVQYAIGSDFALLFPGSQKKDSRAVVEAPLFMATRSNPIPKPMRLAPRPEERSLHMARLESLCAVPLPKMSPLLAELMARGKLAFPSSPI